MTVAFEIWRKKILPSPNLVALKNLPAVQETGVWSLGWEDALEEGMATHSSILARRIPWTEEPGGLQSRVANRHNSAINTFTFKHVHVNVLSDPFKIRSVL